MLKISLLDMSLTITYLRFLLHLPGGNEHDELTNPCKHQHSTQHYKDHAIIIANFLWWMECGHWTIAKN